MSNLDLIRRVRASASLTQKQLAEVIGVNRMSIMRWEAGRVAIPPPVVALFKLIEANPEDTLALLRNGKPISNARPRTRVARPEKEPAAEPVKPQEFGGAGAPPARRQLGSPATTQEADDSWRFGF